MAFVALSMSAQTEFKVGGIEYTPTSITTCEVSDVDNKDSSGDIVESVVVPQTVQKGDTTYTVTRIGEYAFRWNECSSVTLPESIDTIDYYAFGSCDNLTTITLPGSLKYIDDYAFNASGLTTIDIPASVEYIGANAFFSCNSLTSITGMEGVKEIGGSAFYKCAFETFTMPEQVDSVPKSLFMLCPKLKTVKLSSKTRYIGEGAFNGCKLLENITLPSTVQIIGDEAFLDCKALTSFTLPAATTEIGTGIVARTGVTTLSVESGNSNFTATNNCIYSADKRLLYAVPMKGTSTLSVQSGCIGINGGAFWGSEITKVTLPDGLLAIDDYVFCESSLAEIDFPSSLVYMGEQALAGTKLKEVTLPENMPTIANALLASSAELTTVTIPSAVNYIELRAFYGCTNLKTIYALGSTAPELEEMYESYEGQFYNMSDATIYVPKGSKSSYEAQNYDDYLTISETEAGTLQYVSTNPADGSTIEPGYTTMAFDVTFGEDITIVKTSPEAYLRVGGETGGKTLTPYGSWNATKGSDAKTLRVWGDDGDGYTDTFKAEDCTTYTVIIPAGVVKNAAGEMNERIVINFTAKKSEPTVLELVSSTPATGAEITSKYVNIVFDLVFSEDITVKQSSPAAEIHVGSEDSSETISPVGSWHATLNSDSKSVRIWGDDGDGYTDYFTATAGKTYYIVIPAGVVQNANGVENGRIVIALTYPAPSAIEGVEDANKAKVESRYTINGQKLNGAQRGINIVKMSNGTVRKVVVK